MVPTELFRLLPQDKLGSPSKKQAIAFYPRFASSPLAIEGKERKRMRTIAAVLVIVATLTSCAPRKKQVKKFSPVQYSELMKEARNYRIK
jgi:hypothetical protein